VGNARPHSSCSEAHPFSGQNAYGISVAASAACRKKRYATHRQGAAHLDPLRSALVVIEGPSETGIRQCATFPARRDLELAIAPGRPQREPAGNLAVNTQRRLRQGNRLCTDSPVLPSMSSPVVDAVFCGSLEARLRRHQSLHRFALQTEQQRVQRRTSRAVHRVGAMPFVFAPNWISAHLCARPPYSASAPMWMTSTA
jgi:hypothetical protein